MQDYKDEEFKIKFNDYIVKITKLIENLNLNVVVANIYSIYSLFIDYEQRDVSNKCLKKNFVNLLKILIPFTPHLANECLEQHDKTEVDEWPKPDSKLILNNKIKIAVQINGKTREIIEVEKDLDEKNVINESKNNKKINDNLVNKKILRIVFVKNKIINYLIK
jgi:leucyl-tRNA synthetase